MNVAFRVLLRFYCLLEHLTCNADCILVLLLSLAWMLMIFFLPQLLPAALSCGHWKILVAMAAVPTGSECGVACPDFLDPFTQSQRPSSSSTFCLRHDLPEIPEYHSHLTEGLFRGHIMRNCCSGSKGNIHCTHWCQLSVDHVVHEFLGACYWSVFPVLYTSASTLELTSSPSKCV